MTSRSGVEPGGSRSKFLRETSRRAGPVVRSTLGVVKPTPPRRKETARFARTTIRRHRSAPTTQRGTDRAVKAAPWGGLQQTLTALPTANGDQDPLQRAPIPLASARDSRPFTTTSRSGPSRRPAQQMAADPGGGPDPVGSNGSRLAPHAGSVSDDGAIVVVVVVVVVVVDFDFEIVVLVRVARTPAEDAPSVPAPQPLSATIMRSPLTPIINRRYRTCLARARRSSTPPPLSPLSALLWCRSAWRGSPSGSLIDSW